MSADTPDAPQSPRKPLTGSRLWLFRSIAIGAALFMALAMLEIAVRLMLAARPNDIETLRRFERRKTDGQPMTLIDFVRISDDPDLVYELIPRIEGTFREQPVKFNSHGFRDDEWPQQKPDGVFRLAALGDSVTFGWGAPKEVRFTEVLGKFLNDTAAGQKYEVLNFGVPGYNTVLEANLLRKRVLAFSPDAVMLCYVPDNDDELPNFVSKPRDLWTSRRLYILDLALKGRSEARGALEPGVQGADPENIPAEYLHLVGPDKARAALASITQTCRETSIPALFLLDYWTVEPWRTQEPGDPDPADPAAEILALATDLGYILANPRDAQVQFLRSRGWHSFALCVDPDDHDAHPNAIRHALMAREAYRALLNSGALPDAVARRANSAAMDAAWDTIINAAAQSATVNEKWKTPAASTPPPD